MLHAAPHPPLLIAAGANRKLTANKLRAFVDKQGIPFVTTQMGKGVVDETHPLWLGNAAMSSGDFPHRAIDAADLILNVGHDSIEKPPFVMKSGERKVIHINFQPAQIDAVYFPHAAMVGDIANSIWQLNEALQPQPHWDFAFMLRVRDALRENLARGREDAAFPVTPRRLVHEVRKAMPDDGIIALDNGIYKIWFARNYPALQPNTVLLDNPCFITYARSYGAHGHRLETSDALAELLRECLSAGGVHLIDVPVDYSDNDRLLNTEIPRLSAAV